MRVTRRSLIRASAGLAGLAVLVSLTAGACSNPGNSNTIEHNATNAGIDLLLTNQPVPIFPTSELRKNIIEVEAIQALGTPTTTFFFPEGTTVVNGKFSAPPFKICPSQGEPVHATDQLSNPQQVVPGYNNGSDVVGQMDPNGIYAGGSAGTYVLCVNANGQPDMAYWEGPVYTESGSAVWNASGGPGQQIESVGPSHLPVCTLVTSQGENNIKAGTRYFHCSKT